MDGAGPQEPLPLEGLHLNIKHFSPEKGGRGKYAFRRQFHEKPSIRPGWPAQFSPHEENVDSTLSIICALAGTTTDIE